MTIYISIPTLEDNQLLYTVFDAINNAKNKKDIHIGVAFMSNDDFYNNCKKELSSYKNVKIKKFDVELNKGVGVGRNNAWSMYDNQDYFLQVDSHTLFAPKWDEILISTYKKAVKATGNKKTVLTGYLPPYVHTDDGKRLPVRDKMGYPFYLKETWFDPPFPKWTDLPLSLFPNKKDTFYPSVKFCANFAFGDKNFANNTGLDKDVFFMEEEIIQSINLFSDGFSLVFPNIESPLWHLYSNISKDNITSKRTFAYELFQNKADELFDKVSNNFNKYILDESNSKKIKQYLAYAKIEINKGTLIESFIPNKYV
jgi:hypothetical protein